MSFTVQPRAPGVRSLTRVLPTKRISAIAIGLPAEYLLRNPSRPLPVEHHFDFEECQMSLSAKLNDSLLQRGFSRRDLGRMASLLTAGATMPFFNEYAMAQDAHQRMLGGTPGARRANDPDAVRSSSNENPMGPCQEGLEAIATVGPPGGRDA